MTDETGVGDRTPPRKTGSTDGSIRTNDVPSAVVIGIDGGDFEFLSSLMDAGHLPNLQRIRDDGVFGELKSTQIPSTAPAWVSMVTGVRPDKHGCFNFLEVGENLRDLRTVTSGDVRAKTLFDIYDDLGLRTISVNLPVTYPVRNDGIFITSLLTRNDDPVPAELLDEFDAFRDYRIVPDESLKVQGKREKYVRDVVDLEENRFECGKYLFQQKEWDLFFYVISGSDWLSHRAFHEFAGDPDSLEVEAFERFDQFVGWFYDNRPEDSYFFVVSDHGFKRYSGKVNVNTWLEEHGYLRRGSEDRGPITVREEKTRESVGDTRVKVNLDNLPGFVKDTPLLYAAGRKLFKGLQSLIPIAAQQTKGLPIPEETLAYSISGSAWGIHVDPVAEQRDEAIRRLIRELRDFTFDGEPVFETVSPREEIFSGPATSLAPDILLRLNDFYIGDSRSKALEKIPGGYPGHDDDGVLFAAGPDITHGDGGRSRIIDVTPTLLYLVLRGGIEGADGSALDMVGGDVSDAVTITRYERSVKEVGGDQEEVTSRLEDLGYL